MNFFDIIIYGYLILATYCSFILIRDRKTIGNFFYQRTVLVASIVGILLFGALLAFDARFIEPWTINTTTTEIKTSRIPAQIKIAFISDIQVGNSKKASWVEKIVDRIQQENPDLVLLGGDQIDNEGTFEDESVYLEPLKKLAEKYPIYAVLGNHEYGIGNKVKTDPKYWVGDRSQLVINRLRSLNIPILRNDLACPQIKDNPICIYGVDDPWGATIDYTNLNKWNQTTPLILLTHNPDAVISSPSSTPHPDLVLAGHTHGGQVWLPFIGPLGEAGIQLPKKYYRGLNYYQNIPILTSVGIGESGGTIRFWTLPEINIINLKPQE